MMLLLKRRLRIDTMIDAHVWMRRREKAMSIEALWAVEFTGANGARVAQSGGVIVIETGTILGGDSWQWYTGTYTQEGKGKLAVRLQTGVHYTTGGQSIFGGPLRPMILVGDVHVASDHRSATANLAVEGVTGMHLVATLRRVAELPNP
jgi:hypothetical protein